MCETLAGRESRRSARTRDRPAAVYTAVEEEEEEEPVPPPTKEERWARRSRHGGWFTYNISWGCK